MPAVLVLLAAIIGLLAACAHGRPDSSARGRTATPENYVKMSGEELYQHLCSSCHGVSGHGDGAAAQSYTATMPDLTLLARRAGDTFPRSRVEQIIEGTYVVPAHGSRARPVWGADLSSPALTKPKSKSKLAKPKPRQSKSKSVEPQIKPQPVPPGHVLINRIADYLWLVQQRPGDDFDTSGRAPE